MNGERASSGTVERGSEPASESDDARLDAEFDRALSSLFRGASLDEERDDTFGQSRDTRAIELAHLVATSGARRFPSVRGFEIVLELGRGGMGAVFLARQQRVGGRLVALKVLPVESVFSRRARERFQREIETLGSIRHPHVVQIHDVARDGDVLAFAMEWVDGPSLGAVIARLRESSATPAVSTLVDILPELNPEAATASYAVFVARIAAAIARALAATHTSGIVHRDVKPSNILLRADGTPLLADFGVVRDDSDDGSTRSQQFVGTPMYASPEQLRGESALVDQRSDVYSLGVTLYEALALTLPARGRPTREILAMIESGSIPDLRRGRRWIPVDLATVVHKAIEADPARRYPSAAEFAEDLERLLNLEPIRAKPASTLVRATRYVARHRRSVGASALSALAVSMLAAAIIMYVDHLPTWAAECAGDARLELLSPHHGHLIVAAREAPSLLPEARARMHDDGIAVVSRLDSALELYARAIRYSIGHDTSELRRERDVARIARALWADAEGLGPALAEARDRFPHTTEYAATFRMSAGMDIEHGIAPGASQDDMRALGLLAFLIGDPKTCDAAWGRLDPHETTDPVRLAATGQIALRSSRPALALQALRIACESLPNAQFLWVDIGESARQCGEIDFAEAAARYASKLDRPEPFEGLEHLFARIDLARGRDDEAFRRFAALAPRRGSMTLALEYARLLERRGMWATAASMYFRPVHRFQDGTLREFPAHAASKFVEMQRLALIPEGFAPPHYIRLRTQSNWFCKSSWLAYCEHRPMAGSPRSARIDPCVTLESAR